MRTRSPAAAGILLLGLVAGCGGDGAEDGPADTTRYGGEMPTEPAPGTAAEVTVASTSLGEVLVDGAGMTLYMFDPDEQGPSTCEDDCAAAWPPLVADGAPVAGDGVDSELLGTVERSDGSSQVTYDGWPLYYFAQDAAAGDVNGQGVNEVWWVLMADGEPVRE